MTLGPIARRLATSLRCAREAVGAVALLTAVGVALPAARLCPTPRTSRAARDGRVAPPAARGEKLTAVPNSPSVTACVTAGNVVIAGTRRDEKQPLWFTSASNPSAGWKRSDEAICQGTVCRGPNQLAYDPVHRVVYAANWGAGLWRYVAE